MTDKILVDKDELQALLEKILASSVVDFELYGMARQLSIKLYEGGLL